MKSASIRIFYGPYFPVFNLNTVKYRPEKTTNRDTFYAKEKNSFFQHHHIIIFLMSEVIRNDSNIVQVYEEL